MLAGLEPGLPSRLAPLLPAQKLNRHADPRRLSQEQHFRPETTALPVEFGVGGRIERTEQPAFLIFETALTIGVEQIALVRERPRYLPRALQAHGATLLGSR